MPKDNQVTRLKLLKIWEILIKETDENNPITSVEIMRRLEELGIHITRKTLYRDMEMLEEFGYDVHTKRAKNNEYYIDQDKFSLGELHILLDAIQAAAFISEEQTKDLVERISNLAGKYKGEVLQKNLVDFPEKKEHNKDTVEQVNLIVEALSQRKKISFRYFDYNEKHEKDFRKEGDFYKANPIATVFSNDRYYLIVYSEKYDELVNYRVDRMDSIEILKEKVPKSFFPSKKELQRHKEEVFSMYSGKPEEVTFKVGKDMLNEMFDHFGKITFNKYLNGYYYFTKIVQVSPTFISWCISFGDKLQVESPKKVRIQLNEYIQTLAKIYS